MNQKPWRSLPLLMLLSIPCFLAGQYPGMPLATPGTLHSLPLVFTGREADIILPGDTLKQDYIKTHLVEVAGYASDDINTLLAAIRKKASAQGADAVLLRDFGSRVMGPETAALVLTGVAVKYTSNVNYLDTIVKQRVITVYRNNGPTTVLLNFDWRGQWLPALTTADDAFYADSVMPFDMHHALFGKLSLFEPSFDVENKLTKVRTSKACTRCLDITINLPAPAEKYIIVRVQGRTDIVERFKVSLVYNSGRLTGAIVNNHKGNPLYYLHYRYDGRGRVVQERWEKLTEGKAQLWLDIENRFFSNQRTEWPVP